MREVAQHAAVAGAAQQRGGHAAAARAPRAPDAVHVVLYVLRHVVVDHVLDVREVQAWGEDLVVHCRKFEKRGLGDETLRSWGFWMLEKSRGENSSSL